MPSPTPPDGYVWAIRMEGVVTVPERQVAGTHIAARQCGVGDCAIIPYDEAVNSSFWLSIDFLDNVGSAIDNGVSTIGLIDATTFYFDTDGAEVAQQARLTLREDGCIYVDDLGVIE